MSAPIIAGEDILVSNEVRVDLICEKTTGSRTVFRDEVCMQGNIEIIGSIVGNLSTGSPSQPCDTYMGGGVFYNNQDKVSILTNSSYDTGTWSDHTADNTDESFTGTIPFFQGTGVGNTLYIGSEYRFSGFQLDIQTPVIQGESSSVSMAYWDGSSWLPFTHLDTNASSPYDSYTQAGIEKPSVVNVRMGITTTNMSLVSLNGVSKYWVRIVVDSAPITTIPEFKKIFVHTDSLKVNTDGFIEYFGNSRPIVSLPLGVGLLAPFKSKNPSNLDIYVSDGLGAGINENSFSQNKDNSISFHIAFPSYIDTSYPVVVDLTYMVFTPGSGESKWVTRWGMSKTGDSVYVSSANRPPTSSGEKSVTSILPMGSVQRNTQYQLSLPIDVSTFDVGNPVVGGGGYQTNSLLWVTIERIGSDVLDTFPKKIVVIQVDMKYVKWSEGGNIRSFQTNT